MYQKLSTSTPLSKEQKDFASRHHDEIVYGFLAVKKLDREEYWDIVIFNYLHAVRLYLERPELQTYSFKTIAYRQMQGAVYDYWTYLNRPKRKAFLVELDRLGNKEEYLYSIQTAPAYEYVEADEQWQKLQPLLTEKELEAVIKRADGYSYREIAQTSGISCSGIRSRFYRMRCKVKTSDVSLGE